MNTRLSVYQTDSKSGLFKWLRPRKDILGKLLSRISSGHGGWLRDQLLERVPEKVFWIHSSTSRSGQSAHLLLTQTRCLFLKDGEIVWTFPISRVKSVEREYRFFRVNRIVFLTDNNEKVKLPLPLSVPFSALKHSLLTCQAMFPQLQHRSCYPP